MKKRQKLLTDQQWELVEPLLPETAAQEGQPGAAFVIESGLF
jgi:transposase